MSAQSTEGDAAVLKRLSRLDRFLPLWIGVAMGVGLALGSVVPGVDDALDSLRVGTVSLPIAVRSSTDARHTSVRNSVF